MPSVAVRVHHVGVHPSVRGPGVQPSGVQLSGVRTAGSLVSGPSVRPSGVRPVRRPACPGFSRAVSVRPSHPSGPASARRRRLGDTSVRRGNPHAWNESSSMWSGPVPAARSTARVGLDAGTAAEVVCRPAGERRPRTWPGCARAGWLRPTEQGGQTAARAPIASDCARQGCWLRRDVPAPAAWLPSCWSATTLRGCRGA
jgi:hypothetical protein